MREPLTIGQIEKAIEHLYAARHSLEALERRTKDLDSITSHPRVSIRTEHTARSVYLYIPFEAIEQVLVSEIADLRATVAREWELLGSIIAGDAR